jgi:membrane fusion protein (multidrug efflux system)
MGDKFCKQLTEFAIVSTLVLNLSACGNAEQKSESSASANSSTSNETSVVGANKQEVHAVTIKSMRLNHRMEIPGELRAFQTVPIEAKVQGYVSAINVDRATRLKTGEKILTIFCPELDEHLKEQEAKSSSALSELRKSQSALESTRSKLLEGKARLDADLLTLDRLKETAAKMAGSVAINDIDVQSKTVESDKARVQSMQSEVDAAASLIESNKSQVIAAKNVEKSVKALQAYLTIKAPFDGVITERNVHVGSMVGPQQNTVPLVVFRQVNILRLVVAMPESSVSGLTIGARIPFSVPAYPGTIFHGIMSRPACAIDTATRTMPVELDVPNSDNKLEPGMFATVHWQISRPTDTLFVPSSAVATDLKGTFVNLLVGDSCKRVPVEKGQAMNDMIEIVGDVKAGDRVALRASDELKDGTHISMKMVSK